MINKNDTRCPKCGGELQPRGFVMRKIKLGNYEIKKVKVRRFSCRTCGAWHRELPNDILPYKQYSKTIIDGFSKGKLSTDILEYENFPCDMTVKRWKNKQ